jgi:hypothetical protein
MKLTGENWQLGEKPVPVPICPPQISHGLTRDRTRASAVRGRRLAAWVMSRSTGGINLQYFNCKLVTSRLSLANEFQYRLPSLIEHKQWQEINWPILLKWRLFQNLWPVRNRETRTYSHSCMYFYSYFNGIDSSPVKRSDSVYGQMTSIQRSSSQKFATHFVFLMYPAKLNDV